MINPIESIGGVKFNLEKQKQQEKLKIKRGEINNPEENNENIDIYDPFSPEHERDIKEDI